ncbi:hypothetical protein [Phyllobacterium sp. 22552]|uniref:hypothetical protein n=1 Tax=Phyllobacterium sp. 22552 TaxID=3453941 RepID=UPI003F840FFF
MAFNFSSEDYKNLDKLIDTLLIKAKNGEHDIGTVRGAITHIISAAAQDNKEEVLSWVRNPATLANWEDASNDLL